MPSSANLNGTVARPTASHVWDHIDSSLTAGSVAGDAPHDDNPTVDQPPPPKPVFFAALIANGWFLKAKSFAYSPGVISVPARFRKAFLRWPLFILFWVAALAVIPSGIVAASFAAWVVWIGLDIRRTMANMKFQVELKAD